MNVKEKLARRKLLQEKKSKNKVNPQNAARMDIRNIMRGFRTTGQVPQQVTKRQIAGDMSNIPDLMTIMNKIESGKQTFRSLPADIRKRFGNDPQEYLKFLQRTDKKAIREGIDLGLYDEIKPDKQPDPQRVIIINDETKNDQKTEK